MAKAKFRIGIGNITIDKAARQNVLKVLDSGRLSYGNFTRKFEESMAKLHGRRHAIFTNSGTSALHVSLNVLKDKFNWSDNDEVLVPADTFVASASVILHNRLKPIFVDVEPDFYCVDPTKIEAKITKKTKAIIPVHLFGQSADMKPIMALAKKYKLRVIEDSCETMFVKYKGKPVGFWGDISCYSTYSTHIIKTGEGGLIMTNKDDLAERIKSYINHGRDNIYLSIDDDDNKKPKELTKIIEKRFSFIHLGYNMKSTELEAAIGLAQLQKWKATVKKRQENANFLNRNLKRWSGFLNLPKVRKNSEHCYMLYPIVIINNKIKRAQLVEHLETNGIETRYLMPLLNQPIYQNIFGNIENNYPVAKYLASRGFLIGCHEDLTKAELEYIVEIFGEFFESVQYSN